MPLSLVRICHPDTRILKNPFLGNGISCRGEKGQEMVCVVFPVTKDYRSVHRFAAAPRIANQQFLVVSQSLHYSVNPEWRSTRQPMD
jgi:hypothetical protein